MRRGLKARTRFVKGSGRLWMVDFTVKNSSPTGNLGLVEAGGGSASEGKEGEVV